MIKRQNLRKNFSYKLEKEEFILFDNPDFNLYNSKGIFDSLQLYYSWKKILPNTLRGWNLNLIRSMNWLESNYSGLIIHKHFSQLHRNDIEFNHVIYFMIPDIAVELDFFGNILIMFPNEYEEEAQFLMKKLPREKPEEKEKQKELGYKNTKIGFRINE